MKHPETAAVKPRSTHGIPRTVRAALTAGTLIAALGAGGCAQVNGTTSGSGGSGHPGPAGSGGATGTGATSGGNTDASLPDVQMADKFAAEMMTCTDVPFTFAPKTPTVFVVVDRSGSEFMTATTGTYFTLQASVLQVVNKLQDQVRFGFGDFVGDHASGSCKPVFNAVPIDLNNYTAIQTQYMTDGPLTPFGAKADTPLSAVLPMVKSALMADSGDGGKYMLLVTDGETDFCDDGNAVCPEDAVTYGIQDMYTAGIGTLVIGLPTEQSSIPTASVLQNFANAGAGQTVALPQVSGLMTATDVGNQCMSVSGWSTLLTATGKTGPTSIATYGTPAGTATVFTPASTSQQALTDQISAAVAGVKSCLFDLSNIDGKSIKVDRTQLNQATVTIMGTAVPYDDPNGWRMNTDTQLELTGSACDTWRAPATTMIDFMFPCQVFIVG